MKKSKSKVLRNILIGVGAFVLLVVLVLGYLGFMPGVSALFGSSTPKDLGVKYTAQDYANAHAKMGSVMQDTTATSIKDSIKYSGSKPVTASFTSEELTATANSGKWKYRPVKDVQVKVSKDGTVEVSGIIIKNRIDKVAEVYGYTAEDIKKGEDIIGFVPGNPTFYAKGKATVINNQVSLNIEEMQIGKIDAKNLISEGQAQSIVDSGIAQVPGLNVKSLTFEDGKMNFDGTVPASITRVVD
jgi:hypothetical protein